MTAYNKRDKLFKELQSSAEWDRKIASGVISRKRQSRQILIGSASGIAASFLIAFMFIINPFTRETDTTDYVSAQVTGAYEQAFNGSIDNDQVDEAINAMVVFQ
jgi:ABC-type lipoprotein release transport system permease subunit